MSGSQRRIARPPHAVMMQTLPISVSIRTVAAAASIACPFQASQSRLRPERMSASISANAFSPVRTHAAFSSGATYGQISKTRLGSTQTNSADERIQERSSWRRGIGMADRERSVGNSADEHRAVTDLGRGVSRDRHGDRHRAHRAILVGHDADRIRPTGRELLDRENNLLQIGLRGAGNVSGHCVPLVVMSGSTPAAKVHDAPAGILILKRVYLVSRIMSQRPVRALIATSAPVVAATSCVSRQEAEPNSVAASVIGRKPFTVTRLPSVPCSALSSVASRLTPRKKPSVLEPSNCAISGCTAVA